MRNKPVFFTAVALAFGVFVWVVFTNTHKIDSSSASTTAGVPTVNDPNNIQLLQEILAKEPNNRNAWVQLGHYYCESAQTIPAIEAYGKALDLDNNDPSILAEQGVMFRKLGWFDKAKDNFTKAIEINPSHEHSLYNLGLVYRYDLQDFGKATEAWQKFLALNPTGSEADQVRWELEFLTNQLSIDKLQQ
jgi:tetratricopeptide (TPR) repeat protein